MPTPILPKYSAAAPLAITLGGLASSATGLGRQTTLVDNTTTRFQRILLYPKIKLGTSPAANTLISLYLIRDDGSATPNRTDSAGAADAAFTQKNAQLILPLMTGPSPATGDVLQDACVIENPGPKWGIAVVQGTAVALDATNGNHVINWVGEYPEIQN